MTDGLHAVTFTDREILYLRGNLAYADGIGRDIYDRIRNLPVATPKAQLALEVK